MNIEHSFHRATATEFDTLMSFLNNVFGFDAPNDGGFAAMLPNLYKKEYKPWQNNIIAHKNNEICAAVGLYYKNMKVMDKTLKVAGIGNVAVRKDCRGAGYMKKTMEWSLEDMKNNKADISFLGGDRHRYMYFSYDRGCIRCNITINETSLRHASVGMKLKNFNIIEVTENNHRELDDIHSLYSSQPVHIERPRESLFDTLRAWRSHPYAAYEDDRFAGYFVLKNVPIHVLEFQSVNEDDICSLAASALNLSDIHDGQKTATFMFSEHEDKKIKQLLSLSETHHLSHGEQLSIFNFKNVIEAFLSLKSDYKRLQNGSLVLHIYGENKKERLKISIEENKVFVSPTDVEPHMELTHLEAVRLLCSIYSEHRNALPLECADWFPLPISLSHLDDV